MSRAIGIFFLVLGLALVGVSVLPVIPAPHTAHVALVPLIAGILTAVFGALIAMPRQTRAALTVIVTTAGPYIPWGRRKDDPPQPPAGGTP